MIRTRLPRATMRRVAIAAIAGVALASRPTLAFETLIGRDAIARAVALARSGETERFHEAYRVRVGGPLVDHLEIITEFRRVVLLTEERVRLGDVIWGLSEATAALQPSRGLATLVLHIRFHPQNVQVRLPRFDLVLYASRGGSVARIAPVDITRTPRSLSGQLAPPGSPILGATVEASFDARQLDPQGRYLVGAFQEEQEIARVAVDFSKVE